MDTVKVALTGAAGQIGYHLAFSIARGEVFSDMRVDLVMVDIPSTLDVMQGLKMELEDSALEHLSNIEIYASDELASAFDQIDFAFLVGAFPRKAGMERGDLLGKNAAIFKEQGMMLSEYAKQSCQVLVVGNPCNSNCLIAAHHAENLPNENFFAMTMLDQNRAQYQLSSKAGVLLRDVSDIFIYGNHSATQFPDYHNAKVRGRAATDLVDQQWLEEVFVPTVQKRGAAVIQKRGASSAASAARSAQQTAALIWSKSTQPFSVAMISDGAYDSPKGLVVSMPHVYDGKRFAPDTSFTHSAAARQMIEKSYAELQEEYQQLINIGVF